MCWQASTREQSEAPAIDERRPTVEELARKRLSEKIADQDNAPQSNLIAENLQASSEVVQFQVFGQTQEAINGAPLPLGPSASSPVFSITLFHAKVLNILEDIWVYGWTTETFTTRGTMPEW